MVGMWWCRFRGRCVQGRESKRFAGTRLQRDFTRKVVSLLGDACHEPLHVIHGAKTLYVADHSRFDQDP